MSVGKEDEDVLGEGIIEKGRVNDGGETLTNMVLSADVLAGPSSRISTGIE